LAAGLIALGAISPALAQDEAPVGPSATIGALGAAPEAPEAPEAPAAEAPAPEPSAAATAEAEVTLLPAAPAATATPSAEVAATVPPAVASAPAAAAAATGPAMAAGGAPAAPSSAAAPSPAGDAAASAAASPGGSKTFLIGEGAPGSTASAWAPVAPDAGASGATGAVAAAADAPGSATNPPAADEQAQNPDQAPPGTTVIPSTAQDQTVEPGIGAASPGSQVVNYEANQQMPLNEPQLHSLQEFMNEGVNTSPLGVELQEGARRGKNGREIDGLLVVALQPGSPAEVAGVQAGHRAAHDVLEGAAVAASLVFPPAVLAVPVIETIQLGENYDLIIGVDGNRVTSFMDFQDQLRDAQPGETVYLNILRSGRRLQVPVVMPEPSAAKLNP
jgi:hypothetical protein